MNRYIVYTTENRWCQSKVLLSRMYCVGYRTTTKYINWRKSVGTSLTAISLFSLILFSFFSNVFFLIPSEQFILNNCFTKFRFAVINIGPLSTRIWHPFYCKNFLDSCFCSPPSLATEVRNRNCRSKIALKPWQSLYQVSYFSAQEAIETIL